MWEIFECSCKCVSIIFTILWSIAALFTAVLVAVSVGVVDLNQIALKYDSINIALDNNTIFLPGRYWLGLGAKFIYYPTTWNIMTLTNDTQNIISATTSDPANIYIEILLMYRIRAEFSHLIYVNFPDSNYTRLYTNLAANAIQNSAQKYSVNDFLNLRQNITQTFSNTVNLAFRENFAEIMSFQVGQILFDDVYENFINQQAITKNEFNIHNLSSQIINIDANTRLLNSQTELTIFNILSSANQNASITLNNAVAKGDMNITISQAQALQKYVSTVNGLNFTTQELNKFLLYDQMNELSSSFNSTLTNYTYGFGSIYAAYNN